MTYRITHPTLGSIFVDKEEFDICVDFAKKNSVHYSIEEDNLSKLLIV